MQAVAIMKDARISPQKARLVADQIRCLPVERALNLLAFSNKKAAPLIRKVLESAIAIERLTVIERAGLIQSAPRRCSARSR